MSGFDAIFFLAKIFLPCFQNVLRDPKLRIVGQLGGSVFDMKSGDTGSEEFQDISPRFFNYSYFFGTSHRRQNSSDFYFPKFYWESLKLEEIRIGRVSDGDSFLLSVRSAKKYE